MPSIYVRLDPRKLNNPDTDLRYVLPDLIVKTCGAVKDDGYDYVGDVPFLLLEAEDIERGLLSVLNVLEHDTTLGTLLRSCGSCGRA